MQQIILQLCERDFIPIQILASLLDREPYNLRHRHISPLIALGMIELRYPETLNHPAQAYRRKQVNPA